MVRSDAFTSSRSLAGVLDDLRAGGWTRDLSVTREGRVRLPGGREIEPSELVAERLVRLEGPTDPAQESLVAAVCWTRDGGPIRGLLVLGYGPRASREDARVLSALEVE